MKPWRSLCWKDEKKDVKAFLDSIPEPLKKTVKQVCTDMRDAYLYAAVEVFGKQKIVVDRYHVAKLYRNPLDKLSTKEMAGLRLELPKAEYKKLEGMLCSISYQHKIGKSQKIKFIL